mgnify:FL=1
MENADQSYIKNGSMLDSATGDETGRTQEDLEANAFAGLLLMPDQLLHEQILLYGLDKDLVTVDSVLMLMDMFAMPYKQLYCVCLKAETYLISRLKSCWRWALRT